ncbi:MAG TPA: lactate utilization protein [Firmicutes bacterium]|jgi:L-lactate utilization protein LutB|nr:lactate utilization protein [Bacillota bacterium]
MNEELAALQETFQRRGFQVEICENIAQAAKVVHEMIDKVTPAPTIGFGNSMTVKSAGLQESLAQVAKDTYIHALVGTAESDKKALTADFYLTSANAVSMDGHIVNIDGNGNRTAATCFGPKQVIYLIGKNKITQTLDEAMQRAKKAAVLNAKRYNKKTPCAVTGKCENCLSPDCVCSVTTIHRKKPLGVQMTLIFIDEEAGL